MNRDLKDAYIYILASTIVVGFFVLTGLLMFKPLPEGSSSVVNLLFGGMVAGFATVLNYFFGSSKSSADKNKLLSNNNSKEK